MTHSQILSVEPCLNNQTDNQYESLAKRRFLTSPSPVNNDTEVNRAVDEDSIAELVSSQSHSSNQQENVEH